jgi:hypothetical protein
MNIGGDEEEGRGLGKLEKVGQLDNYYGKAVGLNLNSVESWAIGVGRVSTWYYKVTAISQRKMF